MIMGDKAFPQNCLISAFYMGHNTYPVSNMSKMWSQFVLPIQNAAAPATKSYGGAGGGFLPI